ncbi:MAG: DUF2007 domain-containing protein [bacterium]
MKNLYSPENDSELALIRSIQDGEGIRYFVHNHHFGTLQVGPKIDLLNAKTIMVSEDQYESTKEIIEDFLAKTKDMSIPPHCSHSLIDKIRMVFETLIFSWFIPGNKWKRGKLGH